MHLTFQNVNDAFQSIVEGIEDQSIETVRTPSRNGPVIQLAQPVIITYTNPRERVLFNSVRDCNPFFHLYESLWMLAGRNDVAPLDYYMGGKYSAFSDDGKTANGAYGYRWRHAFAGDEDRMIRRYKGLGYEELLRADKEEGYYRWDQLTEIIDHLKRKPESRRAVLQMWNVTDDLQKIDSSKDVCCNTAVYFSIRTPSKGVNALEDPSSYLDMTVTNRSNDIIWGMFGANAVHFSFLQEYIACAIGIEVGHYHQFSNNAHVYTETNSGWHPDKWLAEYKNRTMHSPRVLSYGKGLNNASGNVGISSKLFAVDETVELFDEECQSIVANNFKETDLEFQVSRPPYKIEFLATTVQPALNTFHCYKRKDFKQALEWCETIRGADWRVACTNWIQKRKANFEKKGQTDAP